MNKPEWMTEEAFKNISSVAGFCQQQDMDRICNALKEGLELTDDAQDEVLKMIVSDAIGDTHMLLAHLNWMLSQLNVVEPEDMEKYRAGRIKVGED